MHSVVEFFTKTYCKDRMDITSLIDTQFLKRLSQDISSPEEILKSIDDERGIDSYHDFKTQTRTGGLSLHPILESPIYQSNYWTKERNPADFLSSKSIPPSSPEQSGKLYYEKKFPTVFDCSKTVANIPVVVKYSEFESVKERIMNRNSISLEQDDAFSIVGKGENYGKVGTNLLKWFYPGESGMTVYFNFDAAQAYIQELMGPLTANTSSSQFSAQQLVMPQNILDPGRTSFYIFNDTHGKGAYNTMSDTQGRTVYPSNFLQKEYSNVFTNTLGAFFIQSKEYTEKLRYNFQYVFRFHKTQKEIPLLFGGRRVNGPGVPFLTDMIFAIDAYIRENSPWSSCLANLQELAAANGDQISPLPLLQELQNLFEETKDRSYLYQMISVLFDLKRLGDHEQANGVLYYALPQDQAQIGEETKCTVDCMYGRPVIFVTHDILSALYSRLLGNPTIYTDTFNKCLLCYRGSKNDEQELYLNRIGNLIQSLNYFFFLQTMCSTLTESEDNDLFTLIANLEGKVLQFSYPSGPGSGLKNVLLRLKVFNSLFFLRSIYEIAERFGQELKTRIERLFAHTEFRPEGTTHGFNVLFDRQTYKDKNLDELKTTYAQLVEIVNPIEDLAKRVGKQLENFNMFQIPALDPNDLPIFSFQNKLFYDSKIAKSLDVIQFKESAILDIVSKVLSIERNPRPKRLQEEKRLFLESCRAYMNGLFQTEEHDIVAKLQASLSDIPDIPTDIQGFVLKTFQSQLDVYLGLYKESIGKGPTNTTGPANTSSPAPSPTPLQLRPNSAIQGIVTRNLKPTMNTSGNRMAFPKALDTKQTKRFLTKNRKGGKKGGGMIGYEIGDLFDKVCTVLEHIHSTHPGCLKFVPGIGYSGDLQTNTNLKRTRKNAQTRYLQQYPKQVYEELRKIVGTVRTYAEHADSNILSFVQMKQKRIEAMQERMREFVERPQFPSEEEFTEIRNIQTAAQQDLEDIVSNMQPRRYEKVPQYIYVGGDYSPNQLHPNSTIWISDYDISNQCALFETELMNYYHRLKELFALETRDSVETIEEIKDDWNSFQAYMDTLGTPDFIQQYSSDIRTLTIYANFTTDLETEWKPLLEKTEEEFETGFQQLYTEKYAKPLKESLQPELVELDTEQTKVHMKQNLRIYVHQLITNAKNFQETAYAGNKDMYYNNILLQLGNILRVYRILTIKEDPCSLCAKIESILSNDSIQYVLKGTERLGWEDAKKGIREVLQDAENNYTFFKINTETMRTWRRDTEKKIEKQTRTQNIESLMKHIGTIDEALFSETIARGGRRTRRTRRTRRFHRK